MIPPIYVTASIFSEGLAAVNLPGKSSKFRFIDKTGKLVIAHQFFEILLINGQEDDYKLDDLIKSGFSNGVAMVKDETDVNLMMIDKSGQVIKNFCKDW